MVQDMLIQTAEIIEGDLRNMGCGVVDNNQTITEARDTCITFLMAERPERTSVVVPTTYRTDDLEPATANPNDRWLLRIRGANTERIGLVTQFNLRYISKFGEVLDTPPNTQLSVDDLRIVKTIEITLEVQSPYIVIYDPDERYASALWKQTRLASQNLLR